MLMRPASSPCRSLPPRPLPHPLIISMRNPLTITRNLQFSNSAPQHETTSSSSNNTATKVKQQRINLTHFRQSDAGGMHLAQTRAQWASLARFRRHLYSMLECVIFIVALPVLLDRLAERGLEQRRPEEKREVRPASPSVKEGWL